MIRILDTASFTNCCTRLLVGMSALTSAACGSPSDPASSGSSADGVSIGSLSDGLSGGTSGDTTDGADGVDGDSADETSSPIKLDLGVPGDESGGNEGGGECAEVSETADVESQPADILIVIDNSPSMDLEAQAVQQNMNLFSNQIFEANIDAHVAVISADNSLEAGICVDAPLGSGMCPEDTNLPTFLHIFDEVGSKNALEKIIEHYDEWSATFRPDAVKHVVVVTDDNSTLGASGFDEMFRALDPGLAEYTFHAIAAPENPLFACLSGGGVLYDGGQ